jgi:hypothetical protein
MTGDCFRHTVEFRSHCLLAQNDNIITNTLRHLY